jgi:hypothetical protein
LTVGDGHDDPGRHVDRRGLRECVGVGNRIKAGIDLGVDQRLICLGDDIDKKIALDDLGIHGGI